MKRAPASCSATVVTHSSFQAAHMRWEQIHGILVDGDLSGGTGTHLASATGVTRSPFQAAPMRLEQKRNKEQLLEEYVSSNGLEHFEPTNGQ